MTTMRLSALVIILGLTGAATLPGCGSDAPEHRKEAGTLQLALTGISNTGALYRLRNGNFTVDGPVTTQLSTETDPDAPSIQAPLPAGDYTIALADGWTLEKEVDGEFVEAEAALLSENPQPFSISSEALTGVLFEFRSEGEIVELGDGTLEIDIAVDDVQCASPATLCNGVCVDTTTDPDNCGGCGTVCDLEGASAICVGGACVVGMCEAGRDDCDSTSLNGCETDIDNDQNHCGGCNNACPTQGGVASCENGVCEITCNPGFGDCTEAPGCETLTNSNPNHCGGCGVVCIPAPNSTPICQGGSCQLSTCALGWANCNNQPEDGCEQLLNSNPPCGSAISLGSVSGDTPSPNLNVSSFGEKRYRVHVAENEFILGIQNDLSVRFTLSWAPGGTAYSLEAGCDGCTVVTSDSGNPASVTLRWPEQSTIFGDSNSGRDVFVNIVAQGTPSTSPTACAPWQLTVTGNVPGGPNTCSQL